nr:hypothetical protein [Tanacetum cinerariifolium]
QTDEPHLSATTTIVEVPKELPKVSLVNSCLKKLKIHLASFDMVVKERTTSTTITEGTWGFEHTKACFRDDIIPFVKALKELFTSFDQFLIDENKMKNVLQENDRLLTQALSIDIVNLVLYDNVNVDYMHVNACERSVTIESELKKDFIKKNCYETLFQKYNTLEKHCISLEVDNQLKKQISQRNTLFSLESALTFVELFEINDLKAQAQAKDTVILKLKEKLHSLSGDVNERNVKRKVEEIKTLNIELDHKVDVAPLAPKLCKNRTAHTDYIRHTQEEAATLREIVESERLLNPLNTSLEYALTPKNKAKQIRFTEQITKSGKTTVTTPPSKCTSCNGYLFSDNHDACVVAYINSVNASIKSKSVKTPVKRNVWQPTGKVFKTVGHIWKPTGRTFTLVGNVCPLTRIATTTIVPPRVPIPIVNNTDKPVVTLVFSRKTKAANKKVPVSNSTITKSLHMTGDRSQLVNFVKKFLGTVKFGNDHVAKIMGYRDYQIGNVTISRVYYVEGLGHNLFFVGQFCDSDLEVAFRQHTCFIHNLDGASKTESWLWHRRLSHLNFGAINYLASQGLVRGLPKLKFEKDHLCSACAMGKSTKKTHKPKSEDTNQEKLYLLHMGLCRPMRVESINGKKYILVIVDDYSRFTWVKFLRSKDETLDFIIKFLKMI